MQEFDPRKQAFRIAPRVLMGLAGCCVLALGVRLQSAEAHLPSAGARAADAARQVTLQTKAFAESETQPGMAPAESTDVEVLHVGSPDDLPAIVALAQSRADARRTGDRR